VLNEDISANLERMYSEGKINCMGDPVPPKDWPKKPTHYPWPEVHDSGYIIHMGRLKDMTQDELQAFMARMIQRAHLLDSAAAAASREMDNRRRHERIKNAEKETKKKQRKANLRRQRLNRCVWTIKKINNRWIFVMSVNDEADCAYIWPRFVHHAVAFKYHKFGTVYHNYLNERILPDGYYYKGSASKTVEQVFKEFENA